MINQIGPVPTPQDSKEDFNTKAFALLAQLPGFVTETNATADEVQVNADILAAVLLGMSLPEYAGTSTSSNSIGLGTKAFTTQSGKAWTVGQTVVLTSGANLMRATVAGYSGTSLTVDVISTVGSGTYASWTIGLTFAGLQLATSGANTNITALNAAGGVTTTTQAGTDNTTKIATTAQVQAALKQSGQVLQVKTYTDNGASSTANAFVSVTQSGKSFTPKSTNSTIIIEAFCEVTVGITVGVNTYSAVALYSYTAGSTMGYSPYFGVANSDGGLQWQGSGSLCWAFGNSSLTPISIGLSAWNSLSGNTTTVGKQVFKITEVAN